MNLIFEADTTLDRGIARVSTHPAEKEHWKEIRDAMNAAERKLVVIHPKNDRQVQIGLNTVAVVEAEDRMCSVRVITGERYLLSTRLKYAGESLDSSVFVKINNQTIINTGYIKEFSATNNARIQVVLTDGSSYFVSRYYIQNFRGKLV